MSQQRSTQVSAQSSLQIHARNVIQGVDVKLGRFVYANTTPITNNIAGKVRLSIARGLQRRAVAAGDWSSKFQRDGIARVPCGMLPASAVAAIVGSFKARINDPETSEPYGEYPQSLLRKSGRLFGRRIRDPRRLNGVSGLVTPELIAFIEMAYRCHFQVLSIEAYRTLHVPDEVHQGIDAYSSWWHCDQRATDITKVMINLSDVSPEDGPFAVATRRTTAEWLKGSKFAKFGRRIDSNFDVSAEDIASGRVVELVGPSGTAILCNTQLCFHRAGVPVEKRARDIIQLVLAASTQPLSSTWVAHSDPGYGRRWRYHQPRLGKTAL